VGLVLLVGAEVDGHYAARGYADTALSIAWSALASALLAIGFLARRRTVRLAGLGLLGVVTAKIIVVDLAEASSLLRVASFFVLGSILIAASYAYHRLTARSPPVHRHDGRAASG
jgi:uncharacterized membrane protein